MGTAAPRARASHDGPYLIPRESRIRETARKIKGKTSDASRVVHADVVHVAVHVAVLGGIAPIRRARRKRDEPAWEKRERRLRRAPRGFFLDPRARFYSAHGKQFCPIINRAIVGGWLYARGAFHTSECNANQIERRLARGGHRPVVLTPGKYRTSAARLTTSLEKIALHISREQFSLYLFAATNRPPLFRARTVAPSFFFPLGFFRRCPHLSSLFPRSRVSFPARQISPFFFCLSHAT